MKLVVFNKFPVLGHRCRCAVCAAAASCPVRAAPEWRRAGERATLWHRTHTSHGGAGSRLQPGTGGDAGRRPL